MKITPTPPSPVEGEEIMPYVIADPIRNPVTKDRIPAYAGMTMYFHINGHALLGRNET